MGAAGLQLSHIKPVFADSDVKVELRDLCRDSFGCGKHADEIGCRSVIAARGVGGQGHAGPGP